MNFAIAMHVASKGVCVAPLSLWNSDVRYQGFGRPVHVAYLPGHDLPLLVTRVYGSNNSPTAITHVEPFQADEDERSAWWLVVDPKRTDLEGVFIE